MLSAGPSRKAGERESKVRGLTANALLRCWGGMDPENDRTENAIQAFSRGAWREGSRQQLRPKLCRGPSTLPLCGIAQDDRAIGFDPRLPNVRLKSHLEVRTLVHVDSIYEVHLAGAVGHHQGAGSDAFAEEA